MKKKTIWLIIVSLAILAAILWGSIMSNVEQAKYTIVESHDAIEIRDYSPKIIAQTEVSGKRKESISKGFSIIADYIFGNNISSKKVSMTAPVMQQASEKIAMTAPVMQQASEKIAMTAPVMQQGGDNFWKVEFVMPSGYTLKTLPKPNNDLVKLIEVPSARFAVIRFTGLAKDRTLQERSNELSAYIKANNLNAISPPTYAFFNPPWTLPFLRRNEVMIEISK